MNVRNESNKNIEHRWRAAFRRIVAREDVGQPADPADTAEREAIEKEMDRRDEETQRAAAKRAEKEAKRRQHAERVRA